MSDRIICDCMGTSFDEIKKAVEGGAKTIDDVKEATEAGTICCGCDCEIEEALTEIIEK